MPGPLACVVFLLAALSGAGAAAQGERPRPRFILNEDALANVAGPGDPEACSPTRVLPELLREIGPAARIMPTENYYYFDFFRAGKSYSGSLRLAADSRDEGILQFNCYESLNSWIETPDLAGAGHELTRSDGVEVTRLGALLYRVAYGGHSVTFSLNDLSQAPNRAVIGQGDAFAGRIFDESGIRFDILYDRPLKLFYFVLDAQSPVPDAFVRFGEDIFVGKRTGFAFYRDPAGRLILIAVQEAALANNTHYDGPFDQLPENFFGPLGFWSYVFDANPTLRGRVTPGGTYKDSRLIFAILPYRSYRSGTDLEFVRRCVDEHPGRGERLRCLVDSPP
ncbi:MAG TPA: hypothetical protein VF718_10030 [Allosphingosinicella sp.]|jgi:hypothetical protein